MHQLFSYGTLQLPKVQQELFGRLVELQADTLSGYRLEYVEITDAAVIEKSNSNRHPILVATTDTDARVSGSVLTLTNAELQQVDAYEVDDYKRVSVVLQSGTEAWVYIRK